MVQRPDGPGRPTVRIVLLAILVAVHALHVYEVRNRFPFHSISMFRQGDEQIDRPTTVRSITPAVLDPTTCRVAMVSIRAEHGIQPRTGLSWPRFLLRWDNTATFPLRYDVDIGARFAVVEPLVPDVGSEAQELVMAQFMYDFDSESLTVVVPPEAADQEDVDRHAWAMHDCRELTVARRGRRD